MVPRRPTLIQAKGGPVISQLSDNMPLATLLAYLADAPVIETDSSEDQTTYRFQCGCVALRIPDEDVVRVVWCSSHRPASRAAS